MAGHGPGSRAGKACADHLGRRFKSVAEMCRHWGVSPATYAGRIRRGNTVGQALTEPAKHGPEKPCTDHKGKTYPSQTAMFRAYGINYTVFHYRYEVKNWSLEDALETPLADTDMAGAHRCQDHLGNTFPSKKAMCDYWHVPRSLYFTRKKQGLPLEECLRPAGRAKAAKSGHIKDPDGNAFRNLDEMCAHWNVSKAQYMTNIRNGLDIRQALTLRTERLERPKDHKGAEYESINALCRAYGITKTTLRARLELGWTLADILENPGNNSHHIHAVDHLGREYPSQKAMLKAWGVTHAVFKHRLSKGRTLEEALSPGSLHMKPCEDHKGNRFPCLAAMLDYWFWGPATYHHRAGKSRGDMKQVLEPRPEGPTPVDGIEILQDLQDGWYLIEEGRRKYAVSSDSLYSYMREKALLGKIASGELSYGLNVRPAGAGWFHAWGGPAGPSPGLMLNPDQAWLLWCVTRYSPGRG